MARIRTMDDNLGAFRDGDILRTALFAMDENAMENGMRTIVRDAFNKPPTRRPSFAFDANIGARQEKADAYAEYERSLCDAWRSPEDRLAAARRSAGNSMVAAGRSNPDPGALPFENGDDDDDDLVETTCPHCGHVMGHSGGDDDQIDTIVRRTQTQHEGMVRRDVPDARTLRNDHKAQMQNVYDQHDAELREAWRKG
jgi:hypothetical protein